MSRKRAFIILALGLSVAIAYVARQKLILKSQDALPLLGENQIEKLELRFHGTEAFFERQPTVENKPGWKLTQYEEKAVGDARANIPLVNRFVELVRAAERAPALPVPKEAIDAEKYGMISPLAVVTFKWNTAVSELAAASPSNEDVVWLAKAYDNSGYYAFFPRRQRFSLLPSIAKDILENRTALDLRERRATAFETDDLEDLETAGPKCATIQLQRDGDRWVWKNAPKELAKLSEKQIDDWAGLWLSVKAEKIYDSEPQQAEWRSKQGSLLCKIKLAGRLGKKETQTVYACKAQADCQLVESDAFSARYELSKAALRPFQD